MTNFKNGEYYKFTQLSDGFWSIWKFNGIEFEYIINEAGLISMNTFPLNWIEEDIHNKLYTYTPLNNEDRAKLL